MDANKLIDDLGGTTKTAELCEVTVGAVSQWRSANRVPRARLMFLRALRPDLFVSTEQTKEAA